MAWKPGPLPPDTFMWGGVTVRNQPPYSFYFADFCGDHVKIVPGGERVEAADVVLYDNGLNLPPNAVGRAGGD